MQIVDYSTCYWRNPQWRKKYCTVLVFIWFVPKTIWQEPMSKNNTDLVLIFKKIIKARKVLTSWKVKDYYQPEWRAHLHKCRDFLNTIIFIQSFIWIVFLKMNFIFFTSGHLTAFIYYLYSIQIISLVGLFTWELNSMFWKYNVVNTWKILKVAYEI